VATTRLCKGQNKFEKAPFHFSKSLFYTASPAATSAFPQKVSWNQKKIFRSNRAQAAKGCMPFAACFFIRQR